MSARGKGSRYVVERKLGRGGMATVYLAHDTLLGRDVALKVLAAELAEDERFRARFLREARLAARVSHPNVVRVFDAGVDERGLVIVLEYVEGETLAEELARRGPLPADEVAEIGVQLCAALAAAHAASLVHRDVKPQNVLRAKDGTVKLGDFGIARSHDSTALTEAGSVLGTAPYLAPEQARGEPVTESTDLYALGVLLYEALAGRRPHEGATLPELVLRREREAPTAPSAIVAAVPPALEHAILSCLSPRQADRPSSAAALAAELGATLPDGATRPLPPVLAPGVAAATAATVVAPRHRRHSPRRLTLALAGLALVLAVVATAGTNRDPNLVALDAEPTAIERAAPAAPPPSRSFCAELEQRREEAAARQWALDEAGWTEYTRDDDEDDNEDDNDDDSDDWEDSDDDDWRDEGDWDSSGAEDVVAAETRTSELDRLLNVVC